MTDSGSSQAVSDGIVQGCRFYHSRIKTLVWVSVAVLAAVYILSGIYRVEPDEQALVTRFGKLRPVIVLPGTHYRLPYPVDRVFLLKPNEIKNVVVGVYSEPATMYLSDETGAELLTGDENIIHVVLNLQYKITEPANYVFDCVSPDLLVKYVSETVLTDTVARTPVDDLLTSGKQLVRSRVKKLVQQKLDRFDSGIMVVSANLADVSPHDQVLGAFKDVASAYEDMSRIVNEARGEYNSVIPRARAEAQNMVREAVAYSEEKINRAQGDADRFLSMLEQFRRSGQSKASLDRLYIETMEDILPQVKKYIVDMPSAETED